MSGGGGAESDTELALRWQRGDGRAYTMLAERHLDSIFRFVRARCGNDHDAADIVQDVFLELCRKVGNYDAKHPFLAWLYTVARHKVIDHFRRQRPSETFDAEAHGAEDARHPSHLLEEREGAEQAWRAVFRLLPEPQATALWLRVQEQRSIAEISTALELGESNVKVLLFRARQRLAAEWRAEKNQNA